MTSLNLETTTATISTTWERRSLSNVAIDFELYYNEGGMDEAIAAYGDEELPATNNDLPDYM